MPELPQLTSRHVSSFRSVSEDQISSDLPTTMTYDQPITIHARPGTNLWRKPPNTDINNAPTFLIPIAINIHRFHSARVTVSGDWSAPHDQGGLVLFIPDEGATKWIKTGIECDEEKPCVGIVGTRRWSDCSLVPLEKEDGGKVTIQVEREVEEGEKVESLWVYIVNKETGEKMGVRQINWWFKHDILDQKTTPDSEKNRSLVIGVYAARPRVPAGEGKENEELVVKFEEFEVKLFDD
jgi:regulation of enolase protein 1 (concanavalin A-like superfamily)